MSDCKELLKLHLAHTKQVLARSKNNSYSDRRKEIYQEQLNNLFDAISEDIKKNLPLLTDPLIYDGPKKHLSFILKSIEFLDSSTLNQIPYEIIHCLNHAMGEWESPNDFIIVTSLINNVEDFSFEGWLAFDDDLYNDINTKYGIRFNHRLVQINLPRAFARDYLATVVLYHELGHFIDHRFSIMNSLFNTVLDKIHNNQFNNSELDELKKYFPYLSPYIATPHPRADWHLLSIGIIRSTVLHFREYYCDLFAAQYIGEASAKYVTYLDDGGSTHNPSHPATSNRTLIVSDFINNTANIIVQLINSAVDRIHGKLLSIRYGNVPDTDFFNLIPSVLKDPNQLHGVFSTAWKIWLNDQQKLSTQLNNTKTLDVYNIINNLVEKSLGNFIAIDQWQKVATIDQFPTPSLSLNSPESSQLGVLTKQDILELINKEKLCIRPLLSNDQVGEAGIDFRLGFDFLVSIQGREAFINASKNDWLAGEQQRNINQFFQSSRRQLGETFILHPRQTVLAVSLEYVKLPDDCMLMLFMRSSYSRLGLTISTIVQPGYCGCLSLEFTNNNNNPINLAVGARVIQGVLMRVSNPTQYFHSERKYSCQVRPEPSSVINDKDLVLLNELWKLNNKRTTP